MNKTQNTKTGFVTDLVEGDVFYMGHDTPYVADGVYFRHDERGCTIDYHVLGSAVLSTVTKPKFTAVSILL